MNYDNINEKLSSGQPILLDGGIGTEVMRRGVRWRQHGIEDAPDVIRDIHVDYLDAGVDVLTFDWCYQPAHQSQGIVSRRSVSG